MSEFDAAWLRIERAREHRADASAVWNEYLKDHPFDTEVSVLGGGRHVITVVQDRPVPPTMALYLGEWAYNLRAALDYAVYATSVVRSGQERPPKHGQIQCPLYFDEAAYNDNVYRLDALTDDDREILRSMQPFVHPDPDTSALGWLNKLAKIDRHRTLHVITAFMAEVQHRIGVPHGCKLTFDDNIDRVLVAGRADVAKFTVTPWDDSMEIDVQPSLGIDPELAEWTPSKFWRRVAFKERLLMIDVAVRSILVPLEYSCTGASRDVDMLVPAYRAELDERRASS